MEEETGNINEKLRKILLYFRVTPLSIGKSPAENYLGRQLRTPLDRLKPARKEPLLMELHTKPNPKFPYLVWEREYKHRNGNMVKSRNG